MIRWYWMEEILLSWWTLLWVIIYILLLVFIDNWRIFEYRHYFISSITFFWIKTTIQSLFWYLFDSMSILRSHLSTQIRVKSLTHKFIFLIMNTAFFHYLLLMRWFWLHSVIFYKIISLHFFWIIWFLKILKQISLVIWFL